MIILPHPSKSTTVSQWNAADILDFLKNPLVDENRFWEFKLERENSKETRKTFSSFANIDGGFVFYGISDEKEPVGITESATTLNL